MRFFAASETTNESGCLLLFSQISGEEVFFVVAGKAAVVLKFVAKGCSLLSQEKLR